MSDEDDVDDGWPFKEGQQIRTPKGEYGTVFWAYPEGQHWRVFYMLDDGTNDNARHDELVPEERASPCPVDDADPMCVRCEKRPVEYEIPDLYCEVCWKEWMYDDWPN